MSRQQVLQRTIESAFRDVPYPGDDNLVDAPDDYWSADVATGFRGKRWQDFRAKDVWTHCDDLPLLTPRAFHHFLPAHMIHSVLTPLEVNAAASSTVLCLTPTVGRASAIDWWTRRVELFDAAQSHAILEFLRYQDEQERDDRAKMGRVVTTTCATNALAWWSERVALQRR